ncbi:MAG TPA: N-acetylmuramoyl-L-alanine amidase, partial [Chroococcales cyanobacterium]
MKALTLLLIGAIGISGCARLSDPYQAMLEKSYSDNISLSPQKTGLRNRLVAIDAGHGGSETGAKGPGGLLEKDVNLGVALALSRMLEKAGARVILTRSDDSPLVPGKKECSTREELLARVELVNKAHPDLFLSIHHNASLDPAAKGDETQTYYRLDDSGPSLDAARSIHRSLVGVLGLPKERLLAGNYLVLRSSQVPAVLGEASFISNAVIEKKLSQNSRQQLEAEAYFLGIADYFEKGVPQIEWLSPIKSPLPNRPVFEASFIADAVPLDPSSIRVTLDDRPIPFFYDTQRSFLSAQPEGRLSNEKHLIRIEARNVLGNSARALNGAFLVSDPPAFLKVSLPFPAPPKEGPLPIQARVLDAGGFPVRDGTPVKWRTTSGQFEFKESRTIGGIAMNYLTEAEKDPVIVSATTGRTKGKFFVPNKSDHVLFGQVLDPNGQAIAGALVTAVGRLRSPMTRSNVDGFFWIYPFPSGLEDVRVEKGGYRLAVLGARKSEFLGVELNPTVSAALSGKNIVLDPLDGPNAWKNWQVASFLEGYLKVAGAKGILTHQPDQVEDAPYGVLLANRLNADLFLSIGRNALKQPVMAEHYP